MWSQVHAQAAKLGLRVRTYRDENGEEMLKAGSPTAATGGKEEGLYEHNVLMMYMGICGYPFIIFYNLLYTSSADIWYIPFIRFVSKIDLEWS